MKKIPLIKPYITEDVKAKVCEVLDSGYLTEGPVTRAFEEKFKDYIGCGYALAVTSCTTGLEMALRALGIGSGDEVIVPDYTYPATADVINIVGAKIVIVDVSKDTMLIDYDKMEKAITRSTRAIIPVSGFGNPLDYDHLSRIKEKYGVYLIEDAACSIGAEYRGIKVGNQADISVFSLHPRKFITTGEGGMITTANGKWADWMMSYKHFGMGVEGSRLTNRFERVGSNYKLSNILAAVGMVQMQHIHELLDRRLALSGNYLTLLKDHPEIVIPETTARGKHSRQSFCIYIKGRDEVIPKMADLGIEVQIGTYALHLHPAFAPSARCRITDALPESTYAFEHCLTLPLYHELTEEDQAYVVENLLQSLP
ncbi:MAG: DegT/DnrJ/EryC1/StrS family aminotransferase [Deltaproteobacteria bacterium]|jgi:perosamine synthetase|nr:DegT/DnrJ/EryC1/StrS family aminotransferase [Deltaproteobacteria bacterium]